MNVWPKLYFDALNVWGGRGGGLLIRCWHYITLHSLHRHKCNCNYATLITLHHHYNSTTPQLQLQLRYTTLHPALVGEVTPATTATIPTKHNSNQLSVHQRIRSAIRDSQQPTSPVRFLFLKLPTPPCAVLLVYIYIYITIYLYLDLQIDIYRWIER